jgi:hypothetical protein
MTCQQPNNCFPNIVGPLHVALQAGDDAQKQGTGHNLPESCTDSPQAVHIEQHDLELDRDSELRASVIIVTYKYLATTVSDLEEKWRHRVLGCPASAVGSSICK